MDQSKLREKLENYLSEQNTATIRVPELEEVNMGWETELFTFKAVYDNHE
jgi:hypothetical protein